MVDFISKKNGGDGCVREFIEFILEKKVNTFSIIDEIKKEFNYQINTIHIEEIETISKIISQCKGNIYFCGVGKSGNIANHCSDLLKSISINCFYLNILNTLHGDIGTMNETDIVIIFSKSGNTKELIDILPYFQKRKSKMIGICCEKKSKFKELCDITIEMPFNSEISGEINNIPTNSYMSHLLFSNILVSLLKKNISADNYKENHPAGSIGINLKKIKDNIIFDYPKIILETSISLFEILLEMTNKKIGCCFFVDKNDILLGILTDGDIRRLLIKNKNLQTISRENINIKYNYETDIEKYYCNISTSNKYIPILRVDKLIGILDR
jgi:arabinose-5-phosphate isomerase